MVFMEPGVSIKNPAQYASRHIMASCRLGCSEMMQGSCFPVVLLIEVLCRGPSFSVPFPAICPRTVETRHFRHSRKVSDVSLGAARAVRICPVDFRLPWARSPMRGKEGFALLAETSEGQVPDPRVLGSYDGGILTHNRRK